MLNIDYSEAKYACDKEIDNEVADNVLCQLENKEPCAYITGRREFYGREFTVRGECHGYVADKCSGTGGFGYDPLFVCEAGCYAELSPEEKDRVSHRGIALRKFEKELKKYKC